MALALALGSLGALLAAPVLNGPRAQRICRPAPPRPATNSSAPACLVIGDSVSLGYTGAGWGTPDGGGMLTLNMTGTCDVVHAPYSGDGGACDTRYGLQCGELWLTSALGGGAAPKYAAIVFNFGLHDTNDLGFDEEARDEFVALPEYGQNLANFLALIRKHQPQAQVSWLSSTPMHFDLHLNANVVQYNALAHKLLVEPALTDSYLDLYKVVTDSCGAPPYYGSKLAPNAPHHCALISDNEECKCSRSLFDVFFRGPREAFSQTTTTPRGGGCSRATSGRSCAACSARALARHRPRPQPAPLLRRCARWTRTVLEGLESTCARPRARARRRA